MGFFYTQQLRDRLNAGASLNNRVLKVTLLARAPQLNDDDARASLRNATTLTGLLSQDGWEEVSAANYAPQNTTTPLYTVGNNNYVQLNTSLVAFPSNMARTPVQAVVFSINGTDIGLAAGDKVLFGTTTPFGDNTIMQGGDGISARIDTGISRRWLFGYALNTGVVTAIVEGTTVIQQGAPPYEVSHVHHSWLLPQRINYIANPSWEGGVTHWQTTSGVMDRQVAGADFPSHWLGHALGAASAAPLPQYTPGDRLYLKSNSFYPRSQDFTFQIMAKGHGIARAGIVYWPRDYSEHASDWGLLDSLIFEEWVLNTNTFVHMRGVRRMSDGYEAALLIEVRKDLWAGGATPEIWLDLGLVEEGVLLNWSYFDGDSTYGGPDDYSWYGDTTIANKRGKSYSLWYNNRRSIAGRLFGRLLDDTAYYTSADEQLDSLVSQWTPAGAVVFPHWDVLDVNDLEIMPVDRSATTLVRDVWPEMTQPFRVISTDNSSATGATLTVVGEGAYPVTSGYIQSGTNTYAITVAPRVYDPADLYDLSRPQTLSITWPSVPAFQPHTLYLERGSPYSPQSWAAVSILSATGSARYATGAGTAADPSVRITVPGGQAAATGAASNATAVTMITPTSGQGAGTGLANDATITKSESATPGTATAVGVGQSATTI